jgi:hypothetical protein
MPKNIPKKGELKSIEFTQEQTENFVELALILKRIHIRLMNEGYTVSAEGKLIPPSNTQEPEVKFFKAKYTRKKKLL